MECEIQSSKEIAPSSEIVRVYRKLKNPLLKSGSFESTKENKTQGLKPGINSKSFTLTPYEFSFKSYLSTMKGFSYRCINRNICNVLINVPLEGNFDVQNEFLSESLQNHITINTHTDDCTKKQNSKMASINLNNCIIPFESDEGILTEFVLKNPLMQPQMIKVALLQQNKKYKLIEIIKVVQKVRNQLFPKDTDQVFSTIFCKANDSEDPIFNLFRGTIKIPLITKKTTGNQEIVILANLPMLLKMSSENHWFIDATFKVAPHGFKQILNIRVFLPKLGIFYPTCHAFMAHKTKKVMQCFLVF